MLFLSASSSRGAKEDNLCFAKEVYAVHAPTVFTIMDFDESMRLRGLSCAQPNRIVLSHYHLRSRFNFAKSVQASGQEPPRGYQKSAHAKVWNLVDIGQDNRMRLYPLQVRVINEVSRKLHERVDIFGRALNPYAILFLNSRSDTQRSAKQNTHRWSDRPSRYIV